ncbi:MAG: type II toxin-antitoxin system prevent-host-death family antitoxin [Vicinamibacterales bacterium]|jgi:antitoxin (DNA-binding transcriptional repressor) of toxin-antitoxin stability system
MEPIGIRELRNNLSHYVRQVEAGKRISVTAHGRVVAELGPPSDKPRAKRRNRHDELVAAGSIRPAIEAGDPFPDDGLRIKLRSGTVQELIDWTREDKW